MEERTVMSDSTKNIDKIIKAGALGGASIAAGAPAGLLSKVYDRLQNFAGPHYEDSGFDHGITSDAIPLGGHRNDVEGVYVDDFGNRVSEEDMFGIEGEDYNVPSKPRGIGQIIRDWWHKRNANKGPAPKPKYFGLAPMDEVERFIDPNQRGKEIY